MFLRFELELELELELEVELEFENILFSQCAKANHVVELSGTNLYTSGTYTSLSQSLSLSIRRASLFERRIVGAQAPLPALSL